MKNASKNGAGKINFKKNEGIKMRIETKHIFPLILITIDIIAGAIYACHGDYKKLIYWIAAAVLNITVTF